MRAKQAIVNYPNRTNTPSISPLENAPGLKMMARYNKRMQSDFGELALASAADARRYTEPHERPFSTHSGH